MIDRTARLAVSGALCLMTAVAASSLLTLFDGTRVRTAVLVATVVPFVLTAVGEQWTRLQVARPQASLALVALGVTATLTESGVPLPRLADFTAMVQGVADGWVRTLDSTAPAPASANMSAWVPMLAGIAAICAIELVLRLRAAAAALLPSAFVLGVAQLYAPTSGSTAVRVVLAYCSAAVVVLLAARAPDAARSRRDWRSLALASLGSVGACLLVATTFDPGVPYSATESHVTPVLPVDVVNPLDDIPLQLTAPDRVVFRVTTNAAVDRWRVAVLDRAAGDRWTATGRLEPLGAVLPPDPAVTVPTRVDEAVFDVGDLPVPWLPTAGRTIRVDGITPFVDASSGTIAAGGRPLPRFRVVWRSPVPGDRIDQFHIVPVRESRHGAPAAPAALRDLAKRIVAGREGTIDAALAIERYLRDNYRVVDRGPRLPVGHTYLHLVRFLEQTRSGTYEQFAAAFAALAREAGISVRIAVGYHAPTSPSPDGVFEVRSRDVFAWPEVELAGVGWVALDPAIPASGGKRPGGAVAQNLDVLRSQMPTSPSTLPTSSSTPSISPPTSPPIPSVSGPPDEPTAWSTAAGLAGVALAFAGAAGSVPAIKVCRRRRRRQAGGRRAVLAAWLEVTDLLHDAGFTWNPGATPQEIARRVGTRDHALVASLLPLARAVSIAAWGHPRHTYDATAAWVAVEGLRGHLMARPVDRLKLSFSLRSLRV